MKKSSIFQIAGGVTIASAGLFIFFKNINLVEIWNQIRSTEWWIIAAVAGLSPLSLWFRAIRWKIILPQREGCITRGLFPITIIAFMINNILPARLGEAARAYILWRKNKFTAAESVGSLVLERTIDSVTYLSFLFIPIFLIKGLNQLYIYGIFSLLIFLMVVVGIGLYAFFPQFTKKILKRTNRVFPDKVQMKVNKIGRELISNLDWAFSIKKSISVIFLSYLTLFCYAGMIWLLGIKIESFGFLDSMFGVAFAALGAAIPLSPGYVGTLHAMLLEGLKLLGVTASKAGAIAVLYHAIGYIIVTLMGIYFYFAINVSIKDVEKAKQELNR